MRTKGKDFAVTFEGHRDHARGGDPMIKRSIPAIAKLNLSLVLSLALLAVAAGKAAGADASCPPPAVALTADKTDINVGESVSVSWSAPAGLPLPLFVPNHYTWSGSRELAAHSGNRTVTGFSAPGSYYIAIRSTDTCFETYPVSMLTIKVHALPNVYFSPSTAYPNTGNSVTLSWNCTANCEGGVAASAGLGGSPGLSGTIYPSRASDGSESYSLTVKNAAGGQRTANAWIQWSTPQPDYGDMDCFASGTQITMADGGKKNVEDLQVGDAVRSYDAKTGQFATVKVLSAATKAGGD
ncbi:MAG: hypothetical protein HY554_13925, partial [Elusimicrobia bacterium]|nr:hypothetical protein [Elusimicrobiota bacterium]